MRVGVSDFGAGRGSVRQVHGAFIAAVLVGAILYQAIIGPVDLFDWPMLTAILILGLAVPHGAFDVGIIKHRWRLTRSRDIARIVGAYLGLAALVLATWWTGPGFALASFLLISSVHFGGDLSPRVGLFGRLVLGAALLSATAIFHRDQEIEIFGWLASGRAASSLADVLSISGPYLLLAAAVLLVASARTSPRDAGEAFIVLAAAVVLPPLTFFLIYFCFLHSIRHVLDVRTELRARSWRELASEAWPYAVAPVLASAVGAWLVIDLGAGRALLSSVFVILAALTVPHMLFVESGWSPKAWMMPHPACAGPAGS